MTDLTTDDATRLRELLAKATPGPWATHEDVPRAIVAPSVDPHMSLLALDVIDGDDDSVTAIIGTQADADLIAAAVNALPAALDTIDRLRADNAAYEQRLRKVADGSVVVALDVGDWSVVVAGSTVCDGLTEEQAEALAEEYERHRTAIRELRAELAEAASRAKDAEAAYDDAAADAREFRREVERLRDVVR
jgi:hypothetical protein